MSDDFIRGLFEPMPIEVWLILFSTLVIVLAFMGVVWGIAGIIYFILRIARKKAAK